MLTSSLSFFISARSALQKSSGRMRRQRAGGLRRVSRSGCWRGWPWWLGLWSAHSLPRNACEIHSHHPPPTHSVTPQPTHQRSQNEEGPVCPVRTADDVYSFATPPPPGFPHSFYFPQWTKTPHILWNSWEEEQSLTFVHHLEKSVVLQGADMFFLQSLNLWFLFFLSSLVTVLCFFFHMFACASFNKFWFSHIFTLTTKAKSDSALCDIKSRCAVGPWLLDMSRLDACLACLPPQWALQ